MSPFALFCNSGISVTLNNNSNYSLCLDSRLPPLCDDSCESLLTHMLTIRLEIKGNIGCHADVLISSGAGRQPMSLTHSYAGVWMLRTSNTGCYPFAQALLCINKFAVFD